MKAIIYTAYGGPEVLRLQEIPLPEPGPHEVRIKVKAVSVNYGDIIARNFKNLAPADFNMPLLFWVLARLSFGYNRPKRQILGNTFAGEIDQIGKAVRRFQSGDQVFGYTGEKMGTYTSFICQPETGILAKMPSNLSFEEASTIPYGAVMALNLLKKANIQKEHHILIVGASGGIGAAAVQLVKHYYGAKVSGVCSTPNLAYVKQLGADQVIDHTKEDYTYNGATYDVIFDILGKGSYTRLKKSLKPNGLYLLASFKGRKLLQMLLTSLRGGRKVKCALAIPKSEDLIFLKERYESGVLKPFIDKVYPLEKAADAHSYMESGIKRGNIVLSV